MKIVILFLILMFCATRADAQLSTSLGWQQHTGTSWRSLCPSDAVLVLNEDCSGVVDDWAGGVFDTLRNRLCWWGGGHAAYFGNEIYCFDLDTLATTRITNPALSPDLRGQSGTFTVMDDGSISARHTYNHVAYIPTIDKYFEFGGSTPTNGSFVDDTWFFNPVTNTWAVQSTTGTKPSADFGILALWNPKDSLLYLVDVFGVYSFNPSTLVYTQVKTQTQDCSYRSGWINTDTNELWVIYAGVGTCTAITPGTVKKLSLTGTISSNSWTTVTPSGSTSFLTTEYLGAYYDKVTKRAVIWEVGNTVYTMDSAGATTAQSLGGTGPTNRTSHGSYGRWNYSPTSGVFVIANRPDVNIYTFRLTDAANNDYYNRCHGAGVIYCNGFDTSTEFGSYQTSRPATGPFCPGGAGSCSTLARDATTYSSCGDLSNCGSAVYHVGADGAGGDNASGSYEIYFGTDSSLEIREGESFYWQWKARRTSVTPLASVGGDKSFTMYDYKAGSCATLELTQTNQSWRSLPDFYTECGNRLFEYSDGTDTVLNYSTAYPPGGSFPATDPNFYCRYNSGNPAGLTNNKCPFYEVNSWRTYYCELTIGTWGGNNTTLRCGQFDDGDTDYRWTMNRTNFQMNKEAVATGFNTMSFTNYMTGRGANPITQPAVDMWVDEVILSNSPIPFPGAPPAAPGGPSRPTNIRVTRG